MLLIAVAGAIGWAAANGVFVAHRAAHNREQALVHLGGAPTVRLSPIGGSSKVSTAPPSAVLSGVRSERVSITITDDGADGVTLTDATLTGPYLQSATKLAPNHGSYVAGSGNSVLVGTVTVDCDAAAPVAQALVAGRQMSTQQATVLTVMAKDTNGSLHTVRLTVDTTAYAIQGRVCTR